MVVVPAATLLIVGVVFLLGGYFAAKGNMYGNYLAVILGIILVVLWLFVLQPPPAPFPEINYYLVGIGPIVILVGGILGFLLKEE
jgi:Na+/proline symporter